MTPQQYIPPLVILIMLPIILLRNRAPRTLRPNWMWVTPAIVLPLMGLARQSFSRSRKRPTRR